MLPSPMLRSFCFFLALATGLAGCATVRGLQALRDVEFRLDSVADARLAGVDLARLRSFEDLTPLQATALLGGLMERNLPLQLELGVAARNPGSVAARLVRMDWTLLLAGRDTVSGTLDRAWEIPPGETTIVPVRVSVNLAEFFEHNLPELVDLALAASGRSSRPVEIGLRVQPTIDTALGAMRFPAPITIVRQSVGGARAQGTPASR